MLAQWPRETSADWSLPELDLVYSRVRSYGVGGGCSVGMKCLN